MATDLPGLLDSFPHRDLHKNVIQEDAAFLNFIVMAFPLFRGNTQCCSAYSIAGKCKNEIGMRAFCRIGKPIQNGCKDVLPGCKGV